MYMNYTFRIYTNLMAALGGSIGISEVFTNHIGTRRCNVSIWFRWIVITWVTGGRIRSIAEAFNVEIPVKN